MRSPYGVKNKQEDQRSNAPSYSLSAFVLSTSFLSLTYALFFPFGLPLPISL